MQNLDQYQSANQVEIRFRPGAAVLSKNAKEALDQLAETMKDQKGYVVEVQGFTPGRGAASIQQSQHLADSVVRYLVITHQIPVYRIYELGLGNAKMQTASDDQTAKPAHGSRVEVTLLKNGIGDLTGWPAAGAFDVSAPVVKNAASAQIGAGQTGSRLLLCIIHLGHFFGFHAIFAPADAIFRAI